MNTEQRILNLIDRERNIYEPAELFFQNRFEVSEYLSDLVVPLQPDRPLHLKGSDLVCGVSGKTFSVHDQVPYYTHSPSKDPSQNESEWERLNKQYLGVYTLVNSAPLLAYLGLRSGMAGLRDQTVVDISAGTGHAYASFFTVLKL